jgi:hypothetical protein
MFTLAYPLFRIEIQALDVAMLEEGRQPDTVIRNVRLLSDYNDIVFAPPSIKLQSFLSATPVNK